VIDVKQSLRGQASRQVWDRVERAAAAPQASGSRPTQSQPGPSTYASNFPPPLSSGRTPSQAAGGRPASLVQTGSRAAKPVTASGGRAVPGSTAWASQQSRAPPTASAFPAFPPPSASLGQASRPTPVSVNYASSTSSTGGRTTPAKAAKPVSLASFPSLPATGANTAAERRALFEKPSQRQEMLKRVTGEGKTPAQHAWASGSNSGSTTPPLASSSTTPPAEPNGAGGSGGGKKKGKGKGEVLFTLGRPR